MAAVNDVQSNLFLQVKSLYSVKGHLSDDLLSALHFTFQGPLLPALDILDHNEVTKMKCTSGRIIFQVIGSSGKPYTCFPSSNYCSCLSFTFSVLKRRDISMCKHVLAMHLSAAMKKYEEISVTDAEMTRLINSCFTPQTH